MTAPASVMDEFNAAAEKLLEIAQRIPGATGNESYSYKEHHAVGGLEVTEHEATSYTVTVTVPLAPA